MEKEEGIDIAGITTIHYYHLCPPLSPHYRGNYMLPGSQDHSETSLSTDHSESPLITVRTIGTQDHSLLQWELQNLVSLQWELHITVSLPLSPHPQTPVRPVSPFTTHVPRTGNPRPQWKQHVQWELHVKQHVQWELHVPQTTPHYSGSYMSQSPRPQ